MSEVHQRPRLDALAVALLAGGMACFGSATPTSKIVGRSFPIWLGSATRMLVAAAVLLPLLAWWRRRQGQEPLLRLLRGLDTADRWRLAAIAGVGTFLFSVLMLAGMREAPGSVGAIVMALTPAVTAMGAVAFLGEHLRRVQLVAVALGVAGVVVVNLQLDPAQGSGTSLVLGSLLVFGAVCCEATYSLVGKRLGADLDPLTMTTAAAAGALVLFLPLALYDLVGFDWSAPSPGQWAAAAWWGVGTMALGSVLWFAGMQRVAGATAAPFMAVMPVSALVLSYLLLGEAFQWVQLVGMGLVLAGLLAVVLRPGDDDRHEAGHDEEDGARAGGAQRGAGARA